MLSEIFNPNNYFFNPWAVPVMIGAFIMLSLGVLFLFKNRKDLRCVSFFFVSLFGFIWMFFASMTYLSSNPEVALFWYKKFAYGAVLLMSPTNYMLSSAWVGRFKENKIKIYLFYTVIGAITLFNIMTDFVISGVDRHFYGYYVVFDRIGIFVWFMWLIPMALAYYGFVVYYLKVKKAGLYIKAKEIKLILWGYAVCYLTLSDFLPAIFPKLEIYTSGYITMNIFLGIVFFAVVKYNLFDIETAIHKTIAWMATSFVILVPFLAILIYALNFLRTANVATVIIFVMLSFYVLSYSRDTIQPRINKFFGKNKYRYETAIVKIINDAFASADLPDLSANLLKNISEIFHPRKMYLYIKTDEGFSLAGAQEQAKSDKKFKLEDNNKAVSWVVKNKELFYARLAENNLGFYGLGKKDLAWMIDNKICIVNPILFKNELKGLILLGKKDSLKDYKPIDLNFLKTIKNDLGMAFHNFIQSEKLLRQERYLKENLEVEVASRTAELQAKNNELKKFNDIAINRELKMVELKQRIAELEGAVGQVGGE